MIKVAKNVVDGSQDICPDSIRGQLSLFFSKNKKKKFLWYFLATNFPPFPHTTSFVGELRVYSDNHLDQCGLIPTPE